jgi:threonine/homoserine/homoserine lactone efflux protein
VPENLAHFIAGALLGLSIAAPPGPVIAVMATEAVRGHTTGALLTAAGAITADAVWLGLVALGFIAFLGDHPRVVGFLGLCGAELLLWMAWGALKSAKKGLAGSEAPGSYHLGFLTVLTSPFSFAWWLANGTVVIAKWGWPGVAGLFLSLVAYSFVITFALKWVGARMKRAIVGVAYASAVMLAGFGVYVGVTSVRMMIGKIAD